MELENNNNNNLIDPIDKQEEPINTNQGSENQVEETQEGKNEEQNQNESSFFIDVESFNIPESEPEKEVDPEIAQLQELKSTIEQDELIKGYINAKKAGVSFKEYVDTMLVPDYEESNPERVFKDYLKKQLNLDEDSLQYEYDKFLGEDSELSAAQKIQIRGWAKELNEGKVKPDWENLAKQRQEIAEKSKEKTEEYINKLEGMRINGIPTADGTLEGGYVFDKKSVDKTYKLAQAISMGALLNPDGTPSPRLIEMIAVYANFQDIVTTISSSSESNGKVSMLKREANMRGGSGTTPSQTMTNFKNDVQAQWKAAQQELVQRGDLV